MKIIKFLSVLFLITSGLVGCGKNNHQTNDENIQIIRENAANSNTVAKNGVSLPNFVNLVKQVGNTVVNITANISIEDTEEDIDPLLEFFRQFGDDVNSKIKPQPKIKTAMGSGFIISKDGYILTNAHVVNGATKIIIKTMDKQEFTGKLIGLDTKTDIALLKVDANNLNVAKIGNPYNLEVGEWVAAIGAPFGFDNSVTEGIVSAKGRNLANDTIVPFIQTDVPVNPGNSGGPLFNLNGEVVGINSQIYSRSGGYMGISFSIPIDIAVDIANQLKKYGKISHGMLGIKIQTVTKQLALSFGLEKPVGALVAQVLPKQSGEKAGLKSGDIILKVDGKIVPESNSLPLIISSKKPKDAVNLTVFRDKKIIIIKAILGGDENASIDDKKEDKTSLKLDKFGLAISPVTTKLKKDLNIINGVLVVNSFGVAQLVGIMPNDIILSVDNIEVNNISQVGAILKGKSIAVFLILRKEQKMYVTIAVN